MRKFYKTVIEVEVLSEEPFTFFSLEDLASRIQDDCSGEVKVVAKKTLTPKQCAKFLLKQGSDPALFQIDEKGNDLEE